MPVEPKSHFWSSLPGVLTGLAALLTAGTGLYIATRPSTVPPVAPKPAPGGQTMAVINDPDGYVNVRTGPGTATAIAGTIRNGEEFAVSPDGSAWWRVRTAAGVSGYVHKSRIVLRSTL
jgi:Bacterial SH3 domain